MLSIIVSSQISILLLLMTHHDCSVLSNGLLKILSVADMGDPIQ